MHYLLYQMKWYSKLFIMSSFWNKCSKGQWQKKNSYYTKSHFFVYGDTFSKHRGITQNHIPCLLAIWVSQEPRVVAYQFIYLAKPSYGCMWISRILIEGIGGAWCSQKQALLSPKLQCILPSGALQSVTI